MRGRDFAHSAALGSRLIRMDSTFDPINYGFRSLSELLQACGDVVQVDRGEHDHLIRLKPSVKSGVDGEPRAAPARPFSLPRGAEPPAVSEVSGLPNAPKQSPIRTGRRFPTTGATCPTRCGPSRFLPPWPPRSPRPHFTGRGLRWTKPFERNWALPARAVPPAEIVRIRQLCFKWRLFRLEPNYGGIGFDCSEPELNDIIDRKLLGLVLRQFEPPLDRSAVGVLLYGSADPLPEEAAARLTDLESRPTKAAAAECKKPGLLGGAAHGCVVRRSR